MPDEASNFSSQPKLFATSSASTDPIEHQSSYVVSRDQSGVRSREYSPNTESTNKLLTLMDGAADRARDVLWVAATNHLDQIDAALLRGGRFTEKVEFELPSRKQVAQHIAGWLTKRKVQLAPGITAAEVADMMGDESIANAEAVLQYALNRAISHSSNDQIMVRRDEVYAQ